MTISSQWHFTLFIIIIIIMISRIIIINVILFFIVEKSEMKIENLNLKKNIDQCGFFVRFVFLMQSKHKRL